MNGKLLFAAVLLSILAGYLPLLRAAYDKKNLYFAFECFDTEPHKIKTSIAQRDNISRDDQVGILLDAAGNKQTGYEFYVNPNGIQSDAVNSAVSVDGPDKSPDFVWESARFLWRARRSWILVFSSGV